MHSVPTLYHPTACCIPLALHSLLGTFPPIKQEPRWNSYCYLPRATPVKLTRMPCCNCRNGRPSNSRRYWPRANPIELTKILFCNCYCRNGRPGRNSRLWPYRFGRDYNNDVHCCRPPLRLDYGSSIPCLPLSQVQPKACQQWQQGTRQEGKSARRLWNSYLDQKKQLLPCNHIPKRRQPESACRLPKYRRRLQLPRAMMLLKPSSLAWFTEDQSPRAWRNTFG
mmetsp:Transcript_11049/g.27178  ORF Transcript_11049/g.27178 Transcript_11049/m.27178 type:complete len:224 (+) Transcript_11049:1067-1738(+)